MKICVLTHTFPRNRKDVAAAFMKEFCDGLVVTGNKVTLVAPYDQEFYRRGDQFKIVTFKYIWPEHFHILGYSRTMEGDVHLRKRAYFLLPFFLVFGFFALLRTVRREKIDLISAHWILPNGLIAFLVSKVTGVPYTVTLPGTDTYLVSRSKIFALVAKLVAKKAAGLFSNSSWHLNKILKLGVKPPITEVITYPVDVAKFRPIKNKLEEYRAKHGLQKDNLVILAVGRLVYKKGFNYLIRAMPKILRRHPKSRLLIGGDGDLYERWEALAHGLGVDSRVLFLRTIPRDEIIFYYNMADVMVTPSIIDKGGNIDGRPLVILESMACGKPQVVTKLPGISDSLIDGVHALLVPQKNSEAIALALDKLFQSPSWRRKMGAANIQLARQRLSIQSVGERYTHFFQQILSSSN